MRHRTLVAFAIALAALAAACGDPQPRCADGGACAPIETPAATSSARIVATAAIASPTPEPPTAGSPSPTPPATATLMPPDPRSITPRPTSPPFTPRPRPALPVAADITLGPDGTYVADVDGCQWRETVRVEDSRTGEVVIVLQSSCVPDGGMHYYPATGAVDYFLV